MEIYYEVADCNKKIAKGVCVEMAGMKVSINQSSFEVNHVPCSMKCALDISDVMRKMARAYSKTPCATFRIYLTSPDNTTEVIYITKNKASYEINGTMVSSRTWADIWSLISEDVSWSDTFYMLEDILKEVKNNDHQSPQKTVPQNKYKNLNSPW